MYSVAHRMPNKVGCNLKAFPLGGMYISRCDIFVQIQFDEPVLQEINCCLCNLVMLVIVYVSHGYWFH